MFNWIKELIELHNVSRTNKLEYKIKLRQVELTEKERLDELEREQNNCDSCDVLKHELEVVRDENRRLLDRILLVPQSNEKVIDTKELQPILPKRHLNFAAKRQLLEANSRVDAELLKRARAEGRAEGVKSTTVNDIKVTVDEAQSNDLDDLEKELDIASAAREAEAK